MPPLPPEFLARVADYLPAEAAGLREALARAPSTAVRRNPAKLADPPFVGTPVPWCPEAVTLAERPPFTLDPRLHAGAYYVQDANSTSIAEALRTCASDARAREEPLRILDMCAAPGGKSTLLAAWKRPADLLLANEVVPQRRSILRENLQKWGALGCYIGAYAAEAIPGDGQWDIVLVDAPCSGEGLFRREPMARTQWSPGLIAACAKTQHELLTEAERLLAPGGILLFSTCTTAPEENVAGAASLVARGLEPVAVPGLLDHGWIAQGVGALALPHRTPGEGFFLACFRKTGASRQSRADVSAATLWGDVDPSPEPARLPAALVPEVPAGFQLSPNPEGDVVSLVHPAHEWFWRKPSESTRGQGRKPPTRSQRPQGQPTTTAAVLERKGRDWVPVMSAALLSDVRSAAPVHEVDREAALQLLRGELPPAANTGGRGWTLIQTEGLPLLWTKQMGRRYNALWPKPWRIRMRLD